MGAAEPTLLAGRFELGDWIGDGSLSVVHAALDRVTGREVAIKLARRALDDHEAARRRFEREAAALSVISSTHVVELISAGSTDDGRPFLVLERLAGQDLQEVVGATGPLPVSTVVRCMAEAAAALELAHGVGIVHRDLKPANLFLHTGAGGERVVKVLDFGMVVDTAGPTERMRDAFGGTPFFMAPEQVRGQLSRIGPATDIWAVAFVTLTLLTGEVYWSASTAEEVMREIEASALDRPSLRWAWLPEAFDQWFLRSTRRVPERRFKSVATQAAQLAEALRGVRSPGRAASVSSLAAASTMAAARTPTPSIVRLAGQRAPVIGRQLDHHEVEQLLAPGAVVTLTGTAGIGKTRLAQAVCETAGDRFVDGAWFVALPAGDGDEPVMTAIATALGLEPDATRSPAEHVVTSLATRRVLVVLDGAERVTDAAAVVERLRRQCPAASWLVTSRLPLGVAGERCHGVEPLDVPGPAPISPGEAETFSAIELFVRCARESAPHFELTDDNVDDVVAICRAVEGFPLGIELAAARIQASSPRQIRAALEADAPGDARAATVRHAVEWSYGLLAPDQQRMLRHLAVLPAGLTFDQVKRRLAHTSDDPMYAVLRLVQTHLVAWTSDPPRRLVMLDTVRELCRERSRAAGEDAALWQVAREHAALVAAGSSTGGLAPEAWLALVDAEHDNLRAVLAHLLDVAPVDAMRLAGELAYYWYLRGDYLEGARWLEAAIERGGSDDGDALSRALHGAGRLALLTCRYERAAAWLDRARAIARARRDDRGAADADQLLGSVARERGDYAQARAYHQRSLEAWERIGDAREAARSRNYLVFAAWLGDPAGDPGDVQRAWWQRTGVGELDRLGDPEASVWLGLNRGAILYHAGDTGAARDVLGRAFAEAVSARFHEGIAWALDLLGKTSFARGEYLQARAQLAAALRVHRRLGDRWRCASVLEALAAVAATSDRPARAAVYLGAADAIRHQIGAPVPACERGVLARTERRGTELIGDAFHVGRERGRRAPLDQTVQLSRDVT
jgi:non-specific serine/threonine protein kinase